MKRELVMMPHHKSLEDAMYDLRVRGYGVFSMEMTQKEFDEMNNPGAVRRADGDQRACAQSAILPNSQLDSGDRGHKHDDGKR